MHHFRLVYEQPGHGQPSHEQPAEASWNDARSHREEGSRSKSKQQRHRHSEKEWNELRDSIAHLYIEEGKKAEEILAILKTQHNFQVGLRKLKKWLKDNGISKNVQKSDMFILYAKRQARIIAEGKRTIFYKDGQVLGDGRLDRFETPDGYTYGTPQTAILDEIPELCFDTSLFEFFIAERPIQAIFGDVPDAKSSSEQNAHIHQIGVFALMFVSEPQIESLPILLRQCLLLAKDLMDHVLSSSLASTAVHVSTPPAPRERVPKFQITLAGDSQDMFTALMSNDIISYLKRSETCLKLLQLGPADRARWKQDWYAMTLEEQSLFKKLSDSFFGSLSSLDSAIAFMHISVLLASPKDPMDTVIVRISLGVDIRNFPECMTCQRNVVSIDCISATGAVQLNVPLQPAWDGSWEPLRISTTEITEQGKWSDYVYSLRGWYIHISSYLRRFEPYLHALETEDTMQEDENEVWEETWDPMDVCTPLVTFQPYEIVTPATWCAYNDFELIYHKDYKGDDSSKFDPNATDENVWDPNGN
ncbi:MAG: hypothetical protein Q9160_005152 [Pyrenula sp. 1 TL-2023]